MRALFPLLFLAACKGSGGPAAAVEPVTLHIATINDFHGALYETPARKDPSRATGGLPILAAAIQELRAEHPDLIVLDGGDLFQGNWPVNASNGMGSVKAYNLMDVDAAAVGNHEFDYGAGSGEGLRGALEAAAGQADFAWLAANVFQEDGARWSPDGIEPWTLIERSGVKVGVIGLSTTETPQTTLAKNVADLEFRDGVETVRAAVPELREAGARAIVVVGHLTGACEPPDYASPPTECSPGGEIGALVDELGDDIDLIVAGHAHTLLTNRIGDTFVLESRARGHLINRLDLVIGAEGAVADSSVLHEPWLLEHAALDPGCDGGDYPTEPLDVGGRTLTPSAEALALIDELETQAGSLCDEVGCSDEPLTRTREAESGVGDWVADAMFASMDGDLALTNSGGLRADLPSGTVRREHVQAVMPFDNRLVVVELTGERLTEMFRIGSSGAHGILQLAGGTYHFDPELDRKADRNGDGELEDWENDRLCGVRVADAPIDPDATYRVITTDFLVGGGDHFGPVFEGIQPVEQGPLLREAMADHLGSLDACLASEGPLPEADSPRIRVGPCAQE